jgi:hypothetical protein
MVSRNATGNAGATGRRRDPGGQLAERVAEEVKQQRDRVIGAERSNVAS